MALLYITYADQAFKHQQAFASKKARNTRDFTRVIEFGPSDIDSNITESNRKVLSHRKGGGYWLWKPMVVLSALEIADYGDVIFYCDAGAYLTGSILPLVRLLHQSQQDVMGFGLPLLERQWTKKELLQKMECDSAFYRDTNQILASFFLVKKSKSSLRFFSEFLEHCMDPSKLTDCPIDKEIQYPDFIEHRHDQSIFSLLYKKNYQKVFSDPSQFGSWPELYTNKKFSNTPWDSECKLGERLFLKSSMNLPTAEVVFHHRANMIWFEKLKYNVKYISKRMLMKLKVT